MEMNYANILFDLDGTLTNPKVGIIKSVQVALEKMNRIEDDLSKLEKFIGPPLQQSFMEHYGFSCDEAWTAVRHYRAYFKDVGLFENEVYAGIPHLLQLLQNQGKNLFVATSKPTVFAENIVNHFHLGTFFNGIYGSELDGTRSDKGELISYIINELGMDRTSAVMVGDRKYDIIGAVKNGIASIGVGYGYGSENELQDAGPTYYCKSMKELMAWFLR